MGRLADRERALYEEVWVAAPYEAEHALRPGLLYKPILDDLDQGRRGYLLDVGCGNGDAGLAYAADGWIVTLMDLMDTALTPEARRLPFWAGPIWEGVPRLAVPGGQWDVVTCCDVLEHLPTWAVGLSLDHLLRAGRRVFLSVALQADVLGVWAGRPLHQTVQSFTWWRDILRELGTVIDARDLITTGLFYAERRR